MPSLSDTMLAGGVALHVEAVHGEQFKALTGPDAGLSFTGALYVEPDVVLEGLLSADPRAKRYVEFRPGAAPRLESQGRLQTEDGRVWKATLRPGAAYLAVRFDLVEAL